jgi:hypothetical protein
MNVLPEGGRSSGSCQKQTMFPARHLQETDPHDVHIQNGACVNGKVRTSSTLPERPFLCANWMKGLRSFPTPTNRSGRPSAGRNPPAASLLFALCCTFPIVSAPHTHMCLGSVHDGLCRGCTWGCKWHKTAPLDAQAILLFFLQQAC